MSSILLCPSATRLVVNGMKSRVVVVVDGVLTAGAETGRVDGGMGRNGRSFASFSPNTARFDRVLVDGVLIGGAETGRVDSGIGLRCWGTGSFCMLAAAGTCEILRTFSTAASSCCSSVSCRSNFAL
jgi:hypothetical protein